MKRNSLSHTQTQNQTQTQTLSPQQVLQVRILELTTVELEDKVRSEIMENPALEAIEPETIDTGGIIQSEGGDTYTFYMPYSNGARCQAGSFTFLLHPRQEAL